MCFYLPFTTSRADVFRRSTQNVMVPVSSIDRFEMVRLWTSPLALMRKWFVCLSWIPFLIHMPTTWGWESSTSKVAVSLSVVLTSVRPFLIVIFRAARTFFFFRNTALIHHTQHCFCLKSAKVMLTGICFSTMGKARCHFSATEEAWSLFCVTVGS